MSGSPPTSEFKFTYIPREDVDCPSRDPQAQPASKLEHAIIFLLGFLSLTLIGLILSQLMRLF